MPWRTCDCRYSCGRNDIRLILSVLPNNFLRDLFVICLLVRFFIDNSLTFSSQKFFDWESLDAMGGGPSRATNPIKRVGTHLEHTRSMVDDGSRGMFCLRLANYIRVVLQQHTAAGSFFFFFIFEETKHSQSSGGNFKKGVIKSEFQKKRLYTTSLYSSRRSSYYIYIYIYKSSLQFKFKVIDRPNTLFA